MVLKTFEVCYKGTKSTIEYETELNFGETEELVNKSVDLTDINKPKIKLGDFRSLILLKTLKKAPFPFTNIAHIRNQPSKLVNEILDHIMEDMPLADFLGDWMTSFMGSKVENNSASESTDTVQLDSDGPKKKQTNTKQDGSKSSSPTQTNT